MALDPAERDRRRRTEFEAAKWEQHFDRVLAEGGDYKRSLWWRIADLDSVAIAREIHRGAQPIRVLEPASGSGGTSLELARHRAVDSIVLADISIAALQLARTLATGESTPRVHLLQSDAFALPLADATFDLAWNIGVIEHYPEAQILELVGEMLRVTRPGGAVLVGIPNRRSIANLKAALLGSRFGRRWLRFVPGYRFDSEILYSRHRLAGLLEHAFGHPVAISFAGSALWVGAPERLVRWSQRIVRQSPLSFLVFLCIRKVV